MSALSIQPAYPIFTDVDGQPLEDGYVWIGTANLDPQANPIALYWDVDLTIPAAQPIRTINGYLSNAGTPGKVYAAESSYSIRVQDKRGSQVYSSPDATGFAFGTVVPTGQTVTLNIPASYTDVQDAFDAIQSWVILGTVEIKIADGTYDWTRTQRMNHEFGKNIRVIGNQATPANVVIRGPNPTTFDMFVVDNGYTLGLFDGVSVAVVAKMTLANNFTAVLANNGATLICGTKVKVDNWYYGIAACNGSFILCRYAEVTNAGDVGIWAFNGSTVDAQYASSDFASDVANNWGWGFEAEYGSVLDCSNGSATGCNVGGAGSLSNSTVRAHSFNGSGNVGSGLYVTIDGVIEAHNAVLNNNTRYGYELVLGGVVIGGGITATGNTIAPFNGYAYFDNSGALGARIAANGPFRLDNNGADSTYFNTSGGLQAEIRHMPGATSRWYMQGGGPGTADQPVFGTDGAAADISARFQLKGSSRFFFNNGNGTQAEIGTGGPNTVNHPFLRGNASGGPAELGATGTDATIDLYLIPKGPGSFVRLAAGYNATADAPIAGYIEIKDNTGTIRKLAVIA